MWHGMAAQCSGRRPVAGGISDFTHPPTHPHPIQELMTWEHPFEGLNSYQIIHAVQGAPSGSGLPVPPPWRLPAGTLGQYTAYVALMEACWERDPAKRPSMEEVATRLRAILTAGDSVVGVGPWPVVGGLACADWPGWA